MENSKLFDLTNKVIILTGSSGFLGTKFSEGLAESGANLVLADINHSKSKTHARILEDKYGVDILPLKLDVRENKSIKSMVDKTLKKFSKIDVLVNNAFYNEGVFGRKTSLEKFPLDVWKKSLDVNLTGVFLCSQQVGKIMVRKKTGNIINISSIYGLIGADQRIYGKGGNRSTAVYAATKGGIINLTRYLAAYWNNTGIRVNCISFGGFENNQDKKFIKNYSKKTMLGRMAQTNEGIGPLIFLASDASSYITGSNLLVDGGWTAW